VLRPWCHFELPDSDYVSGGRRNPEMPGPSGQIEPLDPATRVLDIESLGVRVRNVVRFMVLNPTAVGYGFEWELSGKGAGAQSPFKCLTRKGTVSGGRQFEMVFEYVPIADSVAEAFWTFRIPEQNIEVPFLLVGRVSEPRVFFDRPSLNFGQVLIGGARGRATVALVNSESLPFEFALDKVSYDATPEIVASNGRRPIVEFEPSSGLVPAGGSVVLAAMFTPAHEATVNYNVVAVVKNKPTRLALNVKVCGVAVARGHVRACQGCMRGDIMRVSVCLSVFHASVCAPACASAPLCR
jgi:hydrocephalus-inducing protein